MPQKIRYFVLKILGRIPHLRELVCFISWARKKYPVDGFLVHIAITGFQKKLHIGTYQKDTDFPEFIYSSNKQLQLIKDIGTPSSNWKRVFESFDIQIWEKMTPSNAQSIRFGLSKLDEMLAFTIVRESAQSFFAEKNTFSGSKNSLPSTFNEPASICVALWVRGAVRGSVIVHKETLRQALIEAGRKVCIDARFKPVSQQEFVESSIEITIMSDLQIPLSKKDFKLDVINPWAGYIIEYKDKRGWYMPEMFNCIQARSLKKFTYDLALNKAHLTERELVDATVSTFLVHDFIESVDHTTSFKMDASVPDEQKHNFSKALLIETGLLLHSQLAYNQESDGNIPPIFNPLTGTKKQVGWSQLACTSWALAAFGKAIHDDVILGTAGTSFQYLKGNIFKEGLLKKRTLTATLPYFIRTAKILGDETAMRAGIVCLHREIKEITSYEPILYANISSVLAKEGASFTNSINQAIHLATVAHEDFLKRKNTGKNISLAQYPELIPAFLALYDATKDATYREKADSLLNWTRSFQLPHGAFPQMNVGIPNSYTRGTGKIFEVLSLQYPLHKNETQKIFNWLRHMQYTPASLYFIKPELHPYALGGLRHDYLNQELWIDGSAHTLIGLSRILTKNQSVV